jgi:hypothetical protein
MNRKNRIIDRLNEIDHNSFYIISNNYNNKNFVDQIDKNSNFRTEIERKFLQKKDHQNNKTFFSSKNNNNRQIINESKLSGIRKIRNDTDELSQLNSNLDCLVDRVKNFEDLQFVSTILQKALHEINKKQQITYPSNLILPQPSIYPPTLSTTNNNISLCLSSSSSSDSSSCIYQGKLDEYLGVIDDQEDFDSSSYCLAYDNLTYSSSIEDLSAPSQLPLPQTLSNLTNNASSNESLLKKRLKTIKRKDKLRKKMDDQKLSSNSKNKFHEDENDFLLSRTKSLPDLCSAMNSFQIESEEMNFEQKIRKLFEDKTLSKSRKRANFLYLLNKNSNQRCKSLENVSRNNANKLITSLSLSSLSTSTRMLMKLPKNSPYFSTTTTTESTCTSMASLWSDFSSNYLNELNEEWSRNSFYFDDSFENGSDESSNSSFVIESDMFKNKEFNLSSNSFNNAFVSSRNFNLFVFFYIKKFCFPTSKTSEKKIKYPIKNTLFDKPFICQSF